jgi:hypothetical protein
VKNRRRRIPLAFVACMFLGASMASAQATRTWVSGVGNDADVCSRTASCRTFAGAILKTAAGGEISVLDPGGFGAVTITKSLTINGVGAVSSIIGALVNGMVINAGPNDVVTLRHLQINGVGSGFVGIKFLAGGALIVEDVIVHGFQTGIETSTGNTTVNRALISNNRNFGVNALGGTLTVENSTIASNNVGVQASTSGGGAIVGTVRLSNNGVYNNLTGFGCGGGTLASAGNNRKAGNTGGVVPTCTPGVAITIQ